MAVSFKVPKSPSRSIVDIDEFLGVDLTNSGVNMDERRSPNAINMVRNVPGKVRKRTGYKKEIQATSLSGKDLVIDEGAKTIVVDRGSRRGVWHKVYNVYYPLKNNGDEPITINVHIKYKSTQDFYLTTKSQIIPARDRWTLRITSFTLAPGDEIPDVSVNSITDNTIEIEFVSMGIEGLEPVSGLAPEYCIDAAEAPVYGCHIAKKDNTEEVQNTVVNVNRSTATKGGVPYDELAHRDEFTIPANGYTQLYELKEDVIMQGTTLHLDFCYQAYSSTSGGYSTVGAGFDMAVGSYLSESFSVNHLVGTERVPGYFEHVHHVITADGNLINGIWVINNTDSDITLYVSNFSAMYEYDNRSYEWAVAPDTFPVDDVYEDDVTVDLGSGADYIPIPPSPSEDPERYCEYDLWGTRLSERIYGFVHLEFDLEAIIDENYELDEPVYFYLKNDRLYRSSLMSTRTSLTKHFDIYRYPNGEDRYWDVVQAYFPQIPYAHISRNNYGFYIRNIKISSISPKKIVDHTNKWYIYHLGEKFFLRAKGGNTFAQLYTGANTHMSRAWQFDKNLYIIDGKEMYIYEAGSTELNPISGEKAYIPTVTIAKEPTGGGTQYEALNMLQPGFYELFQGTEDATSFQLSFESLDSTECKAWLLNSSGDWDEKEEGTDFTVDRALGKIFFQTAPGESPLTGEDNVKILAYRTVDGYRDRVTKCTTGTLFGVGGAEDRLFLSGNPKYPNWDFFSGQYDPTYFPDTGYSTLGSEQSAIVGYAVINNYLATFKDGYDTSQVVFIREGDLIVNEETQLSDPAFKLINTLQGNGVLSPYSFGYLQTEPIFLTKQGLYSITSQDITGEKYSQNRSFYLDGKLTKEPNLKDAVAVVFKDQYYLCINNRMYILDGMQATRTDRAEPYATRQYAGFLCDNIPATCIWADDDKLYFGTSDGRICYFYNDPEDINSYNDDGSPIYACWETPDLDGKLFYKNKTFRYFAVRLMRAAYTSAKIYAERLGVWSFIKEQKVIGKAFNFNSVDFTKFTFSVDESEKLLHSKLRVKKVDKARFLIENGNLNEPFGLFDLALEYIESGNYKG